MRPQRHVTISTVIDENGQVTQTTTSSAGFSSNEAPMPPQDNPFFTNRRQRPMTAMFFNPFDDLMPEMRNQAQA